MYFCKWNNRKRRYEEIELSYHNEYCIRLSVWHSTNYPPHSYCKYLVYLFISAVFALSSCEKADLISDNPAHTITKAVSQEQLLGDWIIESAVIPVGSFTADIAWDGSRLEITRDSLRFHRYDLVYPASYPGETTDVTLATYPYNISDNCLYIERRSFKTKIRNYHPIHD